MALLIISFSNWRELDGIESSLSERLSRLETRIALSSDGPGSIPDRAAPPARRGPDPTRVYTIETDGAPARGPAAAAVTIAEFSDFQ